MARVIWFALIAVCLFGGNAYDVRRPWLPVVTILAIVALVAIQAWISHGPGCLK